MQTIFRFAAFSCARSLLVLLIGNEEYVKNFMSTMQPIINQGSGAAKPVFAHVPIKAALDFTRLDRTIDRYQLLLLAKRVGKEGGFTPRMLQLLEYYLAYTTAVDWEEGARPIVFQSLARTAMDLGVGERQIQKLEKKLFEVGAIAWNDSGNHKRFGKRCAKSGRLIFAYGVDLTPLAYLQEELQAKLYEKQLYANSWRTTKREISQLRRQIRSLLSLRREQGADATELEHFEQSYEKIAMELRSHIGLARLRSLRQEHVRLEQTLFDALLEANASAQAKEGTPVPMAPPTQKGSRSHVQKVRASRIDHSKSKKEIAVSVVRQFQRSGEILIGDRKIVSPAAAKRSLVTQAGFLCPHLKSPNWDGYALPKITSSRKSKLTFKRMAVAIVSHG